MASGGGTSSAYAYINEHPIDYHHHEVKPPLDPRHFLVLGGSGQTGRRVIVRALKQGYTVTALVRDPTCFPEIESDNLHVIRGTLSQTDISRAMQSPRKADAVIITLNNAATKEHAFSPNLMADATTAALAAMADNKVKRLVSLSALGVGSSAKNVNFASKALLRKNVSKEAYEDHEQVDARIKEAARLRPGQVEFVIARPTMLTNGLAQDTRDYGDEGKGVPTFGTITRDSVAKFMVEAAESKEGRWFGQTPVLAN